MSGTTRTPEQIAADDAAAKQRAAADKAAADKAAAAQLSAKDKAAVEKATADDREARRLGSMGAQVILDPDSEAALGARGGAADTIMGNTLHRDAALVAAGFDPAAPSGHMSDPLPGAADRSNAAPASAASASNTVPARDPANPLVVGADTPVVPQPRDTKDAGKVKLGAGMLKF